MILIILGALIGLWVIVYCYEYDWKEIISYGKAITLFGGFAGTVLGFAAFITLGLTIGIALDKEMIETDHKISAFADINTVSGNAFLISCSIENDMGYRYIVDTENGKTIEEISDSNIFDGKVYIHEGDYEPRVEILSYGDYKNKIFDLIMLNPTKDMIKHADFYVPEGTVTTDFSIDLQ